MAENRQRGPQAADTHMTERLTVDPEAGISRSLVDPGGAQVFQLHAAALAQTGAEIGRLADHAAAKEGEAAGRLAGIDPEFRPSHALTIRGDAADRAGLAVYAAKTGQEISADFQQALLQHGSDPAKLAGILEGKARGWQTKIIPEAWPQLSVTMQGERLSAMREASRNQLAAQHADQQAAVAMRMQDGLAQASRLARTLGLDDAADQQLAASRATFAAALGATDATGRRLVGPMQALEMMKHYDQQVLDARLFGAYDRLDGLAARREYIDEFKRSYTSGQGLARSLNNDQYTRSLHQLEAQYNHDRVQANIGIEQLSSRVRAAVSDMEKGYAIAPDRMAALQGQIVQLGASARDEKLREQMQAAQATLGIVQRVQSMPPEDLSRVVAEERARVLKDGASEADVHRVELAEKVLHNMRSELKTDPLGWAERVGLAKPAPIDLTRQDVLRQIEARVAMGDEVARYYGQEPKYLRPAEVHAMAAAITRGGPEGAAVMAVVASSGPAAPRIMKELHEHAYPAAAALGGLALAIGPDAAAVRDAQAGLALRQTKGHESLAPGRADARPVIVDTLGSSLARSPTDESAIMNVANAIYEVRALREGKKMFDRSIYEQALKEAVGERKVAGTTYGGVVSQNGWIWGSDQIILPPMLRQRGWRQAIDAITTDDLDAIGAGAPLGGDKKPVSLDRVKGGTLIQAGSGAYYVATGNASKPGEEGLVMGDDGKPWLLDLGKLAPILARRRPDLFLGAK